MPAIPIATSNFKPMRATIAPFRPSFCTTKVRSVRLPRKNDPESIRARQAALGLDGEVSGVDLAPWVSAAESVTGVAVIPVSVAQLQVSLGAYELDETGAVVETGRADEAV